MRIRTLLESVLFVYDGLIGIEFQTIPPTWYKGEIVAAKHIIWVRKWRIPIAITEVPINKKPFREQYKAWRAF